MDTSDALTAIARLRRQGNDDAHAEAKSCSGGLSKDVWESVSAFANTGGGILLLGVDERKGFAPAAPFDLDRVRDQFVSGIGDGGATNAKLTNPPHYQMERVDIDGAQVLAVSVCELDPRLKPCYITARGIQAGSYKRVDDKDVRLSPTEIYELASILVPSSADVEPVPGATIADLDEDAVDAAIAREVRSGARSMRGADTREKRMARLGLTDASGRVTLAGLLALGYYPQQFFPLLVVDVAAHPANSKSQGGAVRFVDRSICDGSLPDVVDQAVAAVLRNLRTASVVKGTVRVDVPELPEEVLREVIANAVVHREYSSLFLGQAVSVDVYPNRVEVTSPGGLWGGKTLDNLADGISRCRNASLMRLSRSLPSPSGTGMRVEAQGSGIRMVLYEMDREGLPRPTFEAGGDYFKVTLLRPGHDAPVSLANTDARALAAHASSDEAILSILLPGAPVTAKDLAEGTGLKLDTVRGRLRKLIAAGKVVATAPATSKNRRYLLAQ